MKINWKLLAICIAIPLAAGGAAAFLTRGGMEVFERFTKPPLSPPAWVFPVAWTAFYTLMGISSYLVLTADAKKEEIQNAIKLYGYQLTLNFLWPTLFFNFQWLLFSFLWLALLTFFVAMMMRTFYGLSKPAVYLNIPYFVWLIFAGYLNFTIWWLN